MPAHAHDLSLTNTLTDTRGHPVRGYLATRKMAQQEKALYPYVHQPIEPFRAQGDTLMYKDIDLAKMSLEEAMTVMMADMPLKMRLAGLAPEQRMEGLAPEQRLVGLAPEQRMEGLAPEQRLAGLAPEQVGEALGRDGAVLTLPDDLLKVLPDAVLDTLSPEARERVRQRIGR